MTQEKLWLIEIELPASSIEHFMSGLEDFADSMSCFEDDSEESWKLLIYTQTEPDEDLLTMAIAGLSYEMEITKPEFVITEVEHIDWVAESQKNFKAVEAGKFFVYPSWRKDEIPNDKIAIEIDPKQAFGTGGHETTNGCLIALQQLEENFINILDMGCGSGILAIGASKLWAEADIVAVDNDPLCVEATIDNAKINSVSKRMQIALSDGYESDLVKKNAPFDLIISNILALPLIEFAPKAKKSLTAGGYIILAGLMKHQADSVIQAHEENGFKFVSNTEYGNWSILVMRG